MTQNQMDIGVFIPIGNNGWLMSKNSPQYMPTFQLNKHVVQEAEKYGLDFALSMIKLHGFGGETRFWDYNLESFTLMAGLAAVTERIRLFATSAVLTIPPAIAARMAVTIDSISGGRFGLNLVSGWQKAEYDQMGLWPGDREHFERRYRYTTEYTKVMQELWEHGESNFKGEYFTMSDCQVLPKPQKRIPLVSAGQSPTGMEFAATYADYNFSFAKGMNTPTAHAPELRKLVEAADKAGRDVGGYVGFMIVSEETDAAAMAKWQHYKAGADLEAIAWMSGEAAKDTQADAGATARTITVPDAALNMNMGTLVGSHANVAAMLDEAAAVPGTKGIMLVLDDYQSGMETFGTRIQPLMSTRAASSLMPA